MAPRGDTKPFSRCSLCGALFEPGTVMQHVTTGVHQAALQRMLNSPLSAPEDRNQGYKHESPEPDRRKKKNDTL